MDLGGPGPGPPLGSVLGCSGKIVDHLFIHCSVAFELWSLIFRMFGVQWVLPEKVLDLLCGWQSREPNSDI